MVELSEEYLESNSSDDEEQHSKLINFVSQLDSTQRVKPALRKEASTEISEYNLNKEISSNKTLVDVKELAQVLGKKTKHVSVTKKLQAVTKKSKTLPKPLEKPVEERLKRSVGFEKVRTNLRRWDAIVTRNALKDHLKFPLNDNSMKLQPSAAFLQQFKNSTPLEAEIAKVLKQDNKKEEEEEEFPLTLEEMMEKRKEMAQLRAKLSYKEAKAQRQSKIKSKKYHRILKREKIRQQLKEFELLQKTNPEAALKKLEELDKSRAKERASLRHRNTGLWAKNMSVRAKYDVESRKILADQLKLSREITQKTQKTDSSDEEEVDKSQIPNSALLVDKSTTDNDNPWSIKVSEEVKNFVNDYKKYWTEKNKEDIVKQQEKNANEQTKPSEKNTNDQTKASDTNTSDASEENTCKIVVKDNFDKKSSKSKEEISDPITKNQDNDLVKNLGGNKNSFNSIKDKSLLKNKANKSKKCKIEKLKNKKNVKNSKSTSNISEKQLQKNIKPSICIHPASGVWIVTPVVSEVDLELKEKLKPDIDTMFDDLSNDLLKKAAKKIKKIKKSVKETVKNKKKLNKTKENEMFDLTLKNTKEFKLPDMDTELLEGKEIEIFDEKTSVVADETFTDYTIVSPEIDPKNFIQVKPKILNSQLPETITEGEEAIDDESIQRNIIEEAFGDDDVINEFKEMKAMEDKNKKVEISNSLPGWGEWGGTGVVPKSRKRRRLFLNLPPRKDKKRKDVIINEKENSNIKKHLVKDVPHPFTSVEAFEANIRAPVGRDWVPESAHQSLIEKQVETKLGTVIEPMGEDEIIRLKKKTKSPFQGKKKAQKEKIETIKP